MEYDPVIDPVQGGYFPLSFPLLVKFEVKTDHYQIILLIKSCIFNIGYGRVARYKLSFNSLKKFKNY